MSAYSWVMAFLFVALFAGAWAIHLSRKNKPKSGEWTIFDDVPMYIRYDDFPGE